jgi:voltage-gated sodium channel type IV alpha
LSEAIIKIFGTGQKVYFREGWNIFDLVIIIGSSISIFVSTSQSLGIKGAITILRSFRILRLIRLIKRGKNLQLIFNTFIITLHSLANIGALLLLFIIVYSILGMILFGEILRNDVLNDQINFETFQNAFIVLFITATGDNWNNLMADYSLQ